MVKKKEQLQVHLHLPETLHPPLPFFFLMSSLVPETIVVIVAAAMQGRSRSKVRGMFRKRLLGLEFELCQDRDMVGREMGVRESDHATHILLLYPSQEPQD